MIAFDVTPRFLEITRQRVRSRAAVLESDLAQPLDFAQIVNFVLEQELRDSLAALAPEQQRRVLEYARSLGAALR